MAILNGWLNGLCSSEESSAILEALKNHEGIFFNIFGMNGEVGGQIYISHNHFGSSFHFLFEQLEKLVKAEDDELHGLIYLCDDEHPEFYDTWQVWVIRKGKIEKKEDTFLSPLSEKVFTEDES